ncbi:MAG TPA: NADH-quinone oxidoreductase subunit L [Candidatus Acidoferrales bacterium]|nr:NADH-quinone oxidoreductase subunit L [Candidatus Acidoferrales bacterium]
MTLQSVALTLLLLPAAGAIVLALGALRLPRTAVKWIGPGTVWLSFVCGLILFADQLSHNQAHDFTYWTWIQLGSFNVPVDLLIDRLSVFMILVVSGVGALITTYSVGYMAHEDDPSYARFFVYMNVFIFSMLLLVSAGNFIFLIMGWALVGLSSYLLIGFYYQREAAVLAARKAFVMNVIGDIGLFLGVFLIFTTYHQVRFTAVFGQVPKQDSVTLEVIALLLLVGAIAKSAQLPLHTWLPDAMEGPTPVSALIHAATMVTAGVYLVGRMHPIFDVAQYAHDGVAAIGALSAIFAATVALVQTDIKRVLAYSTMSQIGYMFLGVGVGAYGAAFFHLLAHAFFKALLFMSAGNVIHAMGDEQDMRRYGGLRRQMRLTSAAFLVGSLALVGIFPFVGFFSKDLVLGLAFSKPSLHDFPQIMWVVGTITALLTGFYTGRMWWIAFGGRPSPDRPVQHPHEAPPIMLYPVLALALLTLLGGLLQVEVAWHGGWKLVSDFLAPVVGVTGWSEGSIGYVIAALTVVLSAAVFMSAYNLYVRRVWPTWSLALPWAQRVLEHKYYFDELYSSLVAALDGLSQLVFRRVDQPLLDGTVRTLGEATKASAGALSEVETGYLRNYLLFFSAGAVVILLVVVVRLFG